MDLERKGIGLGKRPALIVVDMIRGFTSAECALGHDCPDVLQANQRLLTSFRAAALPIFFTTVVYANATQARVFRQRLPALNLLEIGSPWTEIDPLMNRQPDEVLIEKQWASAFYQTELASSLIAHQADSLVITGLTTSGCVRATAVDGLQHDYPVTVASDAVGDRNQTAHDANLFDLNAKYADVKTSAQIIQHLTLIHP